ncbi:MAG TPA: NAD-dependent epimerase/dehydratase family protein [Candidatus Hydrogenedens sp.]|nr:NAD-dependent epimerase/dehydratase family protein [Candidatus Hydrogenedens sp.]HOL19145.1 NAD-dependent epimerase/dehydratase family protein [Candidatus Hydrogenedens sp.]HPP58787.1 NAD-dependent epimerase/dehydratase family protein [Candidatus Hydrogenedens sp.]
MKRILITGGSGFVGANLAIFLKESLTDTHVIAFDNLHRRGSELNLPRLYEKRIEFIHGDIRNESDIKNIPPCDWIIECSAEPSVLAGYVSTPTYVLHSNLTGALHCLNWAKETGTKFMFLSTSRVYPYTKLNELPLQETETRYQPDFNEKLPVGLSHKGISELFPLDGLRTLYGATKLAVELIAEEYNAMYSLPIIINRCGIIAGPWQMGRIDQGIVALWLAHHIAEKPLSYIGFGGTGKQVRDLIDIKDLCNLILWQLKNYEKLNQTKFNIGGGIERSFSLLELTKLCQDITNHKIPIHPDPNTRPGDIPYYITDASLIQSVTPWKPICSLEQTLLDTANWLSSNQYILKGILF